MLLRRAFRSGRGGRCGFRAEPHFFRECVDQIDDFIGRLIGREQIAKNRIGRGSGGCGRASLRVVEGHLESQKKNGCAASTDAAVGKTLKDAVEGVGDSVLVESCG